MSLADRRAGGPRTLAWMDWLRRRDAGRNVPRRRAQYGRGSRHRPPRGGSTSRNFGSVADEIDEPILVATPGDLGDGRAPPLGNRGQALRFTADQGLGQRVTDHSVELRHRRASCPQESLDREPQSLGGNMRRAPAIPGRRYDVGDRDPALLADSRARNARARAGKFVWFRRRSSIAWFGQSSA